MVGGKRVLTVEAMRLEHGGDLHPNVPATHNDNLLALGLGLGNALIQLVTISNVTEVVNAIELGILGSKGVKCDVLQRSETDVRNNLG